MTSTKFATPTAEEIDNNKKACEELRKAILLTKEEVLSWQDKLRDQAEALAKDVADCNGQLAKFAAQQMSFSRNIQVRGVSEATLLYP